MNDHVFGDRTQAGRQLAAALARHHLSDPVVLALPRGGVPVAAEVPLALHAPLDLLIVRKIGAPRNPELAVGAIAEGAEAAVVDRETLAATGTSQAYVDRQARLELQEIARRMPREPGSTVLHCASSIFCADRSSHCCSSGVVSPTSPCRLPFSAS